MKFRKSNPHAHNGRGGRPKGAKNRLQGDFVRALADDFAEHGADVIRIARIEEPVAYLKIVASLMPKEMLLGSAVNDLDDETLDRVIEMLEGRALEAHQENALALSAEQPALLEVKTNGHADHSQAGRFISGS